MLLEKFSKNKFNSFLCESINQYVKVNSSKTAPIRSRIVYE